MNPDIIKLFLWANPLKSCVAIFIVNLFFWFLSKQRPVFVIAMVVLIFYLNFLWKHRIRPEILVNPPDHEEWVTLSSYEVHHASVHFIKNIFKSWIDLRSENHAIWTAITSFMWVILAKLGLGMNLLTLLVLGSNALFLMPFFKYLPLPQVQKEGKEDELDDLLPDSAESLMTALRNENLLQENDEGPSSLSPNVSSMPAHDSDEDEFLFDSKHFDSSSSSTSNSFELIHF